MASSWLPDVPFLGNWGQEQQWVPVPGSLPNATYSSVTSPQPQDTQQHDTSFTSMKAPCMTSSSFHRHGQPEVERAGTEEEIIEDAEEIIEVPTENAGSAGASNVPLIPNSRLSADFKEYLKSLEASTTLYPSVFSESNWNKSTKKSPHVYGANPADFEQIWKQVVALAVKYNSNHMQTWMMYRYFLNTLVLQAKLTSIEAYIDQENVVSVLNKLEDAKVTIKYNLCIIEEMLRRYLLLEYEVTTAGDSRVKGTSRGPYSYSGSASSNRNYRFRGAHRARSK